MKPVAISYPSSHPASQIMNKLRKDLDSQGFSFGCLFMAERHQDGSNYGLFFADGMKMTRYELLTELTQQVRHITSSPRMRRDVEEVLHSSATITLDYIYKTNYLPLLLKLCFPDFISGAAEVPEDSSPSHPS